MKSLREVNSLFGRDYWIELLTFYYDKVLIINTPMS